MKRFLLILSIFLCACASAYAQGIGSAKELEAFINACNKGENILQWADADSTVYLSADIDLAKAKKLPQVISWDGKFDGRGHRLMNWKPSFGGLFKAIGKNGIVQNIIIDASCVMKISSTGDEFKVGFIADTNEGIVKDCVNYGTLAHKCSYTLGPVYVGGLVGFNRFSVINCANYGEITTDVSGAAKEEVYVAIGGLCGLGAGKANAASVVAHCTNEGTVKAIASLSGVYAGGITGNAVRTTHKYCINRGKVTADIRADEEGGTKGVAKAAGIAAQTKSTIIRCYNYGEILSMGECGANIGGIVGMPHESLVIADCINYGKVTAKGEQPSNVGGIAGNIGRPVHIRGCINYGEIVFDGISSRARSTAGGIVGNIYCPKSQTAGAYVRECVNHGKVSTAGGGNKYDASNVNAIHAGGIVAFAECRPELRAFVYDCSNDGKVTAASGRSGSIVGCAINVKTGGESHLCLADAAQPKADGTNLWGRVTTPDGKGIQGIVVTDGLQCTATDSDGNYSLKSDFSSARFVYLSLPSTVEIPTLNGVPQFFRRIPHDAKAASANFVLSLREPAKDYTVMMIADPQVRPYGWDNSMERWNDTVSADAEAFRASCTGDVYSINLGDLVYNEMYAWDDYMDVAATIHCPTFNVIGNHDYDQMTLYETAQGNVYYETYVGPTHYSFDLGDIHYVVLNTILYDRPSPKQSYHYGMDDETLAWLQADLSYIPKDKIIVTCTHHNPFKTPNKSPHGSHNVYSLHYNDYLALLSSYKAVYAWNGHNHMNFYYNYKGKETTHGAPNIQCISVARCTGALRLNRELGPFGDPQGYMVLNVRGEQMDWYYKSVGHGQDYQMRAYPPSRSTDGTVKVTIWNWSEGWSTPEWYENGVKVADMELTPGVDPDYYDIFQTVDNQTTRKYCQPSTESMIFSVYPSPGATSGEIRVTDMFGNLYTQKVDIQ
ncbi:MAG: calcineurin-like phosphoesterase C-terminal domain-containing protein [Bacteroidales bacterium]|nr:calcineurin-like phosphoesterase C-terminal domain-containing protein [Bacteroidales bacterium]